MVDYLKNNQKEVIDMFGFKWNEKEERGKIKSIKELMRNLNWYPEKAMTALGIAPSEFTVILLCFNPPARLDISSHRCNIQSCGHEKIQTKTLTLYIACQG